MGRDLGFCRRFFWVQNLINTVKKVSTRIFFALEAIIILYPFTSGSHILTVTNM